MSDDLLDWLVKGNPHHDPRFLAVVAEIWPDYPEVLRDHFPEVQARDGELARANPNLPWRARLRHAFQEVRDNHFGEEAHQSEAGISVREMRESRNSHNDLGEVHEEDDDAQAIARMRNYQGRRLDPVRQRRAQEDAIERKRLLALQRGEG